MYNEIEKEKLEKIAYFTQEVYRRKCNKDRMVDVIQQKFPDCPLNIICSMIWAIDAYVNMVE